MNSLKKISFTNVMFWKREKPFLSLDEGEFIKRIQNHDTTFEVIVDDKHKLYFDIDYKVKESEVFDDEMTERLIRKGLEYINDFFQNLLGDIKLNIAVAESSSQEYNKYSVRFFVSNILTTKKINKAIVEDINKIVKSRKDGEDNIYNFISESDSGLFDSGIYDSNRKMRCVNTSKPNEDRPLNLVRGELHETVITGFYDDELIDIETHYKLPTKVQLQEETYTDSEAESIDEIPNTKNNQQLKLLLDCLNERRYDEYHEWVKIGMILKNENVPKPMYERHWRRK